MKALEDRTVTIDLTDYILERLKEQLGRTPSEIEISFFKKHNLASFLDPNSEEC